MRFNLSLKKHPTAKSCYLTHDDKYLIGKDEFHNWFWSVLNEQTKEYEVKSKKHRTMNSCKHEVRNDIQDNKNEQQLWEGQTMRCEEKKAFNSQTSAEKALNKIWKTNWLSSRKKPCSSYKCPICSKYHLTSQAQNKRRNTNATTTN